MFMYAVTAESNTSCSVPINPTRSAFRANVAIAMFISALPPSRTDMLADILVPIELELQKPLQVEE